MAKDFPVSTREQIDRVLARYMEWEEDGDRFLEPEFKYPIYARSSLPDSDLEQWNPSAQLDQVKHVEVKLKEEGYAAAYTRALWKRVNPTDDRLRNDPSQLFQLLSADALARATAAREIIENEGLL